MSDKDFVTEAVERGATILDQHFGNKNWRSKIDLDKLVMKRPYLTLDNGCGCVLAQLSSDGSYFTQLKKLNIPLRDAWLYGFDRLGNNNTWEDLESIWKAEVTK